MFCFSCLLSLSLYGHSLAWLLLEIPIMFCSLLTLPLSLISLLGSGTLAVPQPQFGGRHGGNQGVQTVYTTIYGPAEYAVQSPAPSVPSTTTALTARTTPPGSGAPSSTPNPSGGRGDTGSGKKGLAYNSSSPDMDIFNSATGITWGVNWGSQRAGLPKKYEFVPQLWSPEKLGSWDSDVAGASNLLSFNEPDIGSQANMPVPSAVSAHIQYMNPKANGGSVKIGSPSVSNGVAAPNAPPMGLDYLSQFLDQCEKATPEPCVVDFVSIHWYVLVSLNLGLERLRQD